MSLTLLTRSQDETRALAARIAAHAKPGWRIALEGELGAGKTAFAKGFAEALGIDPAQVTSPTFTLAQSYSGTLPVHHLDLYRLDRAEQLDDLGVDEMLEGDGVTLIEWAERGGSRISAPKLEVRIEFVNPSEPSTRRFVLTAQGSDFDDVMKDLSRWP